MTDRELLALAAKAAGIYVKNAYVNTDDVFIGLKVKPNETSSRSQTFCWNPLTDDGDALRLAVKLRMQLSIGDGGMVTAYAADAVQCHAEDVTEDVAYCTRRAIVRAAAEIGKGME